MWGDLIAIPLRHLFWRPVTRGKPNQQDVQPKEQRFVTPMEKDRLIGKYFYKNKENREDSHKGEKRTGLTRELPFIDSVAKWNMLCFMIKRIIKSTKFVTRYMEVCPDPVICYLMKNGGG